MDPLASPEPQIVVLEPDDNDNEAEADMDADLHVDFLKAQTRLYSNSIPAPQNQPMDWDSYVVTSAADCTPSTAGGGEEIGSQITDICTRLVDVFSDLAKYEKFLSYRGDAAQDLLDLLQKLLDHAPLDPHFRAILYVALVRLCRKSELYPRIFSLTGLKVDTNDIPRSSGSFGDVYISDYNGKAVCVKVVKMYQSSDHALLHKTFSREAVVWGQLSHPNILPFFGIYRLGDVHKRLCLVSPWMFNGNVYDFLKSRPGYNRTTLVFGVASGMQYLHDNGVVHGDLKCLNILVTDYEQACLADFGLSYVTDATGLRGQALSSNHADVGTAGFEAPELVESDENVRRTEASDVYAFGMVCYEMFSALRPFGKVKPVAVVTKIMAGQQPSRPSGPGILERGLTDEMWAIMKSCWSRHPAQRPTAAEIVTRLPPAQIDKRQIQGWNRTRRSGFDNNSAHLDPTIVVALPHLQALLV
ncbi:hypothetical protein H0H92_012595 [Tricholoma furcatifolium]|nr:hypothetical protein H0H92_012595 [Tricholoma furcatifolium]